VAASSKRLILEIGFQAMSAQEAACFKGGFCMTENKTPPSYDGGVFS
jgi:hypothetical protein